ncbi:hypothetical protein SODALDRAFT_331259 [Sodiomyces alkalinus F11]|uniref:Essential protein Yae1 N-terminal domain-containing protein n=1 Tax=Sodiomyces alkalinus (strain CBS 110278 / VKM F-3762 / F11) TaxID=1314773 RepID=A0A3N2Q4D5_SODAK|nr:hypothetical protein SODALDRAFT_331259 [Sodiomyces alkalinus F11]ROT41518.1 hypothetical protein SODALDRAFT_331259 [Sodiomyces alkalinus F11]
MPSSVSDPFEDIFNLEDRFYNEGYEQGSRDGILAGRIEGRSVGISKGFDKFLEGGRVYGKSLVWANRIHLSSSSPSRLSTSATTTDGLSSQQSRVAEESSRKCSLPPLPTNNARLQKNIVALHALVEPDTLSTENSDEAVNDFDDRIKKAQGRVKVIERVVGEQPLEAATTGPGTTEANTRI